MELLAVLGLLLGVAGLIVVSSLLNGYVLSVVWGWFFVPVLNLPPISVLQAIGIAMVVSFLTYHDSGKKSSEQETATLVAMIFVRPFITLFFGWILHSLM